MTTGVRQVVAGALIPHRATGGEGALPARYAAWVDDGVSTPAVQRKPGQDWGARYLRERKLRRALLDGYEAETSNKSSSLVRVSKNRSSSLAPSSATTWRRSAA